MMAYDKAKAIEKIEKRKLSATRQKEYFADEEVLLDELLALLKK